MSNNLFKKYDIIVIGGGHAGCEAAMVAANLNSKVLMITMNMNTIGQMSCNPAMGGVAKGQIVREIDALGGYSGIIADKSTIQFRMLNLSKGAAMWSPRTQNDRMRFAEEWRLQLETNGNIDFWQETVKQFIIERNNVIGVKTGLGIEIYADAVILAAGTFMNGTIHIGEKSFSGGRMGDRASMGITEQLSSLGFVAGKMKTGTPPRIDGRTLNYKLMEEQKGDKVAEQFSFLENVKTDLKQKSCFITYTNKSVHQELLKGIDKSPMFCGRIKGFGPRYCPSIEDKITRFADKERHQIFVEPEGEQTVEIYVNGFSSSLPEDVQYKSLIKIPGFENAKMFRSGYAIEYDFFQPTQLKNTLETKILENLYFAGQINGTTGYEEAACQGLMAGINAHLKINKKAPFILKRSEAYIGVLIDDLINKGTDEPYRMFTSRAEFRILLRQDNADIRLTEKGYNLGLASKNRLDNVRIKIEETNKIISILKKKKFSSEINSILKEKQTSIIKEKQSAYKLLKRPELKIEDILNCDLDLKTSFKEYNQDSLTQAYIQIKYENYIEKEKELAQKTIKFEELSIPSNFVYTKVKGLSTEGREKLNDIKPPTIGSASRISGISASDISILLLYLGR
ncbi:MAG: tRNA uridine-5-carboxymethylaminomethyl(34) synthesis enzyme MnmG [Bacteroidetes bacterium]|nr:tRNA uridine-5-carboxymethylaminomethyl(34) synthesis enzyme MnmG [Bacteroidota bacterium]